MGVLSDIGAGAAVVFSAYSLWQTSLKRPALKVFVSPVIRYASPYQNSNFEAFAIPLTVTNEGAQTGTVLSMDLVVKNPERSLSKRFFSADVGQWSVEKAQKGDFTPFAPIVLAGRSSHTDTILFHPRREEKVMQIVDHEGHYQFELTLQSPQSQDSGWFGSRHKLNAKPLAIEMMLPVLDHRAFTSGRQRYTCTASPRLANQHRGRLKGSVRNAAILKTTPTHRERRGGSSAACAAVPALHAEYAAPPLGEPCCPHMRDD